MKKRFIAGICLGMLLLLVATVAFAAGSDEKGRVNSQKASALQNSDDKGQVNSLSQRMATVPNVVGMLYRDAIPAIQKAGFSAKANGTESLNVKIKKKVIAQTPAAGKQALKGSFIVVDLR